MTPGPKPPLPITGDSRVPVIAGMGIVTILVGAGLLLMIRRRISER
ncbi:LPXTG cell wall anchor domain-containing protein [Micromonospora sp. NBC_01813]|nr:LPXTG cell wall anchor domain-containing protein [Micromonospora sp. NBC_01813]WSA12921.1 LPXTG cell wall anchor domain-containing protein [Micromonospora sp. NBC_01813]